MSFKLGFLADSSSVLPVSGWGRPPTPSITRSTILDGDIRDNFFMFSNSIMVFVILLGGIAKFKLIVPQGELEGR